MWIWILVAIGVAGLLMAGCGTLRSRYESAPYTVVRSDGHFQVRDYPALTVVETPISSEGRQGDDGGFMRLFRFISGKNEAQQKISMTTPVFMSGNDTNATMAFVMPARMKTGQVPRPSDTSLQVRELPAGRFAVLRYSGRRNAAKEAESLARLKAWMEKQGLESLSTPVYGYFDPPWTPSFLRRNEVMLQTEGSAPADVGK